MAFAPPPVSTMACELRGGETVPTGRLEDRSAVFGVLGQIEALGLELLEFRQTSERDAAVTA